MKQTVDWRTDPEVQAARAKIAEIVEGKDGLIERARAAGAGLAKAEARDRQARARAIIDGAGAAEKTAAAKEFEGSRQEAAEAQADLEASDLTIESLREELARLESQARRKVLPELKAQHKGAVKRLRDLIEQAEQANQAVLAIHLAVVEQFPMTCSEVDYILWGGLPALNFGWVQRARMTVLGIAPDHLTPWLAAVDRYLKEA